MCYCNMGDCIKDNIIVVFLCENRLLDVLMKLINVSVRNGDSDDCFL